MKQAFLITSYTGGNFATQKQDHLVLFLKTIRKFFPNSYICVADHAPLREDIQSSADLCIYDSNNFNQPHGEGERSSILAGLRELKARGFTHAFKFNYDYILTEESAAKLKEWAAMDKLVVSSEWRRCPGERGFDNSVATSIGYWHIETVLEALGFDKLRGHIEHSFRNRLHQMGLKDRIHVYNCLQDALGDQGVIEMFLCAGTQKVHWYDERIEKMKED